MVICNWLTLNALLVPIAPALLVTCSRTLGSPVAMVTLPLQKPEEKVIGVGVITERAALAVGRELGGSIETRDRLF